MAHADTRTAIVTLVVLSLFAGVASCSSDRRLASVGCEPGDAPPACGRPWSTTLYCCMPAGLATCTDGAWRCAPPDVLASSCMHIAPMCERSDAAPLPWPDAGPPPPPDAGPPPFDAGSPPDGGLASWQACTLPSDCVVRAASCCGSCGAATPADMIGVSRTGRADYEAMVCAGPVGCPECFREQDPALVATCTTGACVAVDLATKPITECALDVDCELTVPTCCPCGSDDPWRVVSIARARAGEFFELVCAADVDCAACPSPVFPPGLTAGCDTGHCTVRGR